MDTARHRDFDLFTNWSKDRRAGQRGPRERAFGEEFLKQLSRDLRRRLRYGFSERILEEMRFFYLNWPNQQTLSAICGAGPISGTRIRPELKIGQFLAWHRHPNCVDYRSQINNLL
jgi:hypothetical protein